MVLILCLSVSRACLSPWTSLSVTLMSSCSGLKATGASELGGERKLACPKVGRQDVLDAQWTARSPLGLSLHQARGTQRKAFKCLPPHYDYFKCRALSIFQTGSRPLWTLSPPFPSILPHEKQERWFLETNPGSSSRPINKFYADG